MTNMLDGTLATIDDTIADWEAQPEAWNPGDPLYERPRGYFMGEQTVRPMISILDDHALVDDEMLSHSLLRHPRCEPCQVSWSGPDPCWMCGVDRPATGWAAVGPLLLHAALRTSDTSIALHRMQEQMELLGQRVSDQLDARLQELIDDVPRREARFVARGGVIRFSILRAVENPAAPTVAELDAALDVTHLVRRVEVHDIPATLLTSPRPAPEPPVLTSGLLEEALARLEQTPRTGPDTTSRRTR